MLTETKVLLGGYGCQKISLWSVREIDRNKVFLADIRNNVFSGSSSGAKKVTVSIICDDLTRSSAQSFLHLSFKFLFNSVASPHPHILDYKCLLDYYFPPIFMIWKENHPFNAGVLLTFTCLLFARKNTRGRF